MGKHDAGRLAVIVASVIAFLTILVFNAMAGPGISPFVTTTGNVSAIFDTLITPAGWTFSIWGIIYAWLTLMLGYVLSGLCRRNANGLVYCSPSVLPYGFFVSWILNMGLNVAWLFLWDRRLMIAALPVLFLVACTNYAILFFSCYGLNVYGAWLNKYHKVDLLLFRALIQNGVAIYTTWTTIATLINLTIVMTYEANMSGSDAATVSLCLLTVEVLVWFVLENFVFEKHFRYIFTIYPVVIWALSGNISKNYNALAPSRTDIFTAVLLALACVLFIVRTGLVIWRHIKMPMYQDASPEAMSPMEFAEKQKKIYLK